MNRFLLTLAFLSILSCNPALKPDQVDDPEEPQDITDVIEDNIVAEKECWVPETKNSDDRAFAKDIPWNIGDKVLLLGSDQSFEGCTTHTEYYDNNGQLIGGSTHTTHPTKKTICTVSKANGLKCTLIPDTPLEEGTYRAIYPVYEYVWYDIIHLSFLYSDWDELDSKHQDIVISDPVAYKEGHKLKFEMKHICALIDIDIYPPKSGEFSMIKLFAQNTVFPGKADYWLDKDYIIDEISQGWLNYTTLRGEGCEFVEGKAFSTTTGLLPIQYNGMPMTIHLIYKDKSHYVSDSFAMPSLNFGVENRLTVGGFKETTEPLHGLWGKYYNDSDGKPYNVK